MPSARKARGECRTTTLIYHSAPHPSARRHAGGPRRGPRGTGRAGRTGTAITIVAGANDVKAVAAIEKLIGRTIPYMEQPVDAAPEATDLAPPPQQTERHPHARHRRPDKNNQPRRSGASVARIDDARTRRAPKRLPAEDGDVSHLPAFLLRPVPLKA